MGKILGRYILREVMLASLLVTAVLLVILLANQVAVVLERAAVNQFPQEVVLRLIWLGALRISAILVPIGLLLGVVLAFGRLYHDSEMAAALACGVGPSVIYVPVVVLAVVVSMLLAWLTLALSPQATADALDLRIDRVTCRPVCTDRLRKIPHLRRWQRRGVCRACQSGWHSATTYSWSITAGRASRSRSPSARSTRSARTA